MRKWLKHRWEIRMVTQRSHRVNKRGLFFFLNVEVIGEQGMFSGREMRKRLNQPEEKG